MIVRSVETKCAIDLSFGFEVSQADFFSRAIPLSSKPLKHGFYFDLEGKAARQKADASNPFIDSGELGRHIAEMEKELEEALQAQERQR